MGLFRKGKTRIIESIIGLIICSQSFYDSREGKTASYSQKITVNSTILACMLFFLALLFFYVFFLQEYSPELKSISQKKSSQISQGGEGGITITSIKHSTDNFVPSGGSGGTGNRNSQNSQKNESYSYNNTDTTMTTTAITERQNDTTPRWVDDLRSVILSYLTM